MKPIHLSKHALGYCFLRGFTVTEVKRAIRESRWEEAGANRLQCVKDFKFGREWNGKFYAAKQVKPIFVVEEREIVVITVYTYYF